MAILKLKCKFCGDIVKNQSLFDHWCDVHDPDEILQDYSDLLEKQQIEQPKH